MVPQQHQRARKRQLPFPLPKVGSYLIDQPIAVFPPPILKTEFVGLFVLLVSPYVLPLRTERAHGSTQHKGGVAGHVRVVLTVLGDHLLMAADRELPRDA